jgi:hypothetical protein
LQRQQVRAGEYANSRSFAPVRHSFPSFSLLAVPPSHTVSLARYRCLSLSPSFTRFSRAAASFFSCSLPFFSFSLERTRKRKKEREEQRTIPSPSEARRASTVIVRVATGNLGLQMENSCLFVEKQDDCGTREYMCTSLSLSLPLSLPLSLSLSLLPVCVCV